MSWEGVCVTGRVACCSEDVLAILGGRQEAAPGRSEDRPVQGVLPTVAEVSAWCRGFRPLRLYPILSCFSF